MKTSKRNKKPVHMIDLKTGQIIRTFESICQAFREMRIPTSAIVAVCKHRDNKKSAGGYGWEYANISDKD